MSSSSFLSAPLQEVLLLLGDVFFELQRKLGSLGAERLTTGREGSVFCGELGDSPLMDGALDVRRCSECERRPDMKETRDELDSLLSSWEFRREPSLVDA